MFDKKQKDFFLKKSVCLEFFFSKGYLLAIFFYDRTLEG